MIELVGGGSVINPARFLRVSNLQCRSKMYILANICFFNPFSMLILNAKLVQEGAFFIYDIDNSRNLKILHVTCQNLPKYDIV